MKLRIKLALCIALLTPSLSTFSQGLMLKCPAEAQVSEFFNATTGKLFDDSLGGFLTLVSYGGSVVPMPFDPDKVGDLKLVRITMTSVLCQYDYDIGGVTTPINLELLGKFKKSTVGMWVKVAGVDLCTALNNPDRCLFTESGL
ncbi:MAG: hypothetical protein H0U73_07685 [Tatlockia sp.]|nr:hypothetical protein [Tatlockia sp.]